MKFVTLLFVFVFPTFVQAVDVDCHTGLELNPTASDPISPHIQAVFSNCAVPGVADGRRGLIDKRAVVSSAHLRVQGTDEATLLPLTCRGEPCTIAQLERREWDAASVASLQANGRTIYIDGIVIPNAENLNFVTDINNLRPHPTDYAIIPGSPMRPLYNNCTYSNLSSGEQVLDVLKIEGCSSQKICMAEVNCKENGVKKSFFASCMATPQNECPTADECANRSNILVEANMINGAPIPASR